MNNNWRSQKAERVLEAFASAPLLDQAVYYSPKYLDGNIEKEVCDLLLVHRGAAIAVSLKAQDTERDPTQERRWALKQLPKSLSQLRGARKSLEERHVWCEHPTLGRREFSPGSLTVVHGVALLEVFAEMVLDEASAQEAMDRVGAHHSVMGVGDFLHLLRYLRSWRDISEYLKARSSVLKSPDRLALGAEVALLGFYTAMRDSFDGCRGIADAKIVVARGEHVRQGSAFRDQEMHLAAAFEDVVRSLELDAEVPFPSGLAQAGRSVEELRTERVLIREHLCDLTIQERAALGKQIGVLSARAIEERGDEAVFGGLRFNRRPEEAYMIVVAGGHDQEDLRIDALDLIISYCVYHKKRRGFVFALNQLEDRIVADALHIDGVQPSLEMQMVGEERFGHIRAREVSTAR